MSIERGISSITEAAAFSAFVNPEWPTLIIRNGPPYQVDSMRSSSGFSFFLLLFLSLCGWCGSWG